MTVTPTTAILEAIATVGYGVFPNFLSAADVKVLGDEAEALWRQGDFMEATVGKGSERQRRSEIRADFIHWLAEGELTPAQQRYWGFIDGLRHEINQAFYLNVQDFEAHLAIYPTGAFYKRHLDQHRQTQRRQIACILYLNADWEASDGGQLRIYPEEDDWERFVDVVPRGGTFVCFRCDTIYHEVLPASRQRVSLTGWLCRRA